MGFMDKAKKLAEQAQQKLDEAQKNFNQSASPQSQPEAGGVRYDEHGRPIQETPPASAAPPPQASEPAPPQQEAQPGEPPPVEPPPAADTGGDQANAAPDPFKPLQQ
jgi:hypothetical protein